MTQRTLWTVCALLGVATFVMVALIFPMFPVNAAGDISAYPAPVYAFEFARTAADLIAVFGDTNDPERAQRIAMMDRGNRWDFLFMTLYSAFGVMFGWAARVHARTLGLVIMVVALVGGVADAIETGFLLSITDALTEGRAQGFALTALILPVWTKLIAIGATNICGGVYVMRRNGTVWTVSGIIAVLAGAVSLIGLLQVGEMFHHAGTATGIGWLVMLAYAVTRMVRGTIPLRRPRP